VTAQGEVNGVYREVSGEVSPSGTQYVFYEQFKYPDGGVTFGDNWGTESLSKSDGSSGHSGANCPVGPCPDTDLSSGSMFAETFATGKNDWINGSRTRTLTGTDIINAGPQDLDITVTIAFRKYAQGGVARNQEMSLEIFDSSGGPSTIIFSHSSVWNDNVFHLDGPVVYSLQKNRSYDTLKFNFNLREDGNNPISVWIDEIKIEATIP
jgi:hypothetical protein